jgi:ribosomal protein L11 methyltransferase
VSSWKAWRDVAPDERPARERGLEHLTEAGFIVTSRELARDGPWRIEIFGEADRSAVARAIDASWQWETLPESDWVADNQRSFQPFAVGPFWVHPSHAGQAGAAGSIPLLIDPGMAFGTGTHATTRGCLELLARYVAGGPANAIDVGCGSGILAIAMAKLWRRPVVGSDNDPEAVAVARHNARLNGVAALCQFVEADGLADAGLRARAPYDLIVANILAEPLVELAETFAASLGPGGTILLSGMLVEQADHVRDAYCRHGLACAAHLDLESNGAWWRTLLLRGAA